MNKKSGTSKDAADKLFRGIKRKTRKHYSAEEKISVVLAGLRGEESIAVLCRHWSRPRPGEPCDLIGPV
jgi:transposase